MMRYGLVVIAAGFTGLLSFSLLAVAIGTDYWYIIDVNKPNHTGPDELSSYSGLWRINEGANRSSVIPSFTADMSSLSEAERHLLGLHKVVVIMLPLSLLLLLLGWIFGLVSSLARSPKLLAGTVSYLLFCSLVRQLKSGATPPFGINSSLFLMSFYCLFTLAGVSVYIEYSNQAMEEFQQIVSPENLDIVDVSFGWSFYIAWLSYSLEVATGLLLMLAARITHIKGRYDSGVAIAML